MNIVFAALSYHVFTLQPPVEAAVKGNVSVVLITRRAALIRGDRVIAYRISDTVYMEAT